MTKTLADGQKVSVKGSSGTYELHRSGAVYSCTCPAWRNQGARIDARTCKHLRAYLGDASETARVGTGASAAQPSRPTTRKQAAAAGSTTAPPILLAHKWETDHDPTGWWMSEKLDGIRAYWNGESFTSRLGNTFHAPDWFTANLPTDTLDGELWVGRKLFQRTTSIVRSGASDEWKQVSFVVFDAPAVTGTFEDRITHAKSVLGKAASPHARWLDHVACEGLDHLREELRRVEGLGGEGLMLRRPKSRYEIGRSNSLLKVKTFHDAEARVIAHAPGAGKHKGRLGALVVELADGTKFNVGTGFSDAEREAPPAIGAVITFRYQELSNDGVPRFPSFVGERLDVTVPARIGALPALAPPAPRPATTARAAASPTPTPTSTTSSGGFKVSLVHEVEQKFWEIEVRGTAHHTRFGRVGSSGQTRLVNLGSATAARTDADKRAKQKLKEGYTQQ